MYPAKSKKDQTPTTISVRSDIKQYFPGVQTLSARTRVTERMTETEGSNTEPMLSMELTDPGPSGYPRPVLRIH